MEHIKTLLKIVLFCVLIMATFYFLKWMPLVIQQIIHCPMSTALVFGNICKNFKAEVS